MVPLQISPRFNFPYKVASTSELPLRSVDFRPILLWARLSNGVCTNHLDVSLVETARSSRSLAGAAFAVHLKYPGPEQCWWQTEMTVIGRSHPPLLHH